MIYLISVAAFAATFLGGLFALRLKDRLHLILGFSAGAVIGVTFFDLMPEALELTSGTRGPAFITTIIAFGFAAYMMLDRMIVLHIHHEEEHHVHTRRGVLGAGTLSFHSFLDGLAIGLSFQVSTAVGLVVTLAVLAHDFSDGINTVNMIIKSGGDKARALRWLALDAVAPVIGVLLASFFTISQDTLGVLLALFAGFFLYIGASELLPESHHTHPVRWTTLATIIGIAVMYLVINLAGF
jgi:ZIP family zinc transporter